MKVNTVLLFFSFVCRVPSVICIVPSTILLLSCQYWFNLSLEPAFCCTNRVHGLSQAGSAEIELAACLPSGWGGCLPAGRPTCRERRSGLAVRARRGSRRRTRPVFAVTGGAPCTSTKTPTIVCQSRSSTLACATVRKLMAWVSDSSFLYNCVVSCFSVFHLFSSWYN